MRGSSSYPSAQIFLSQLFYQLMFPLSIPIAWWRLGRHALGVRWLLVVSDTHQWLLAMPLALSLPSMAAHYSLCLCSSPATGPLLRGLGASTDHEFPARHMALEWVPSLCAVLPMGFASVSVCERGYPGLVLSGERAVQRCVDGNGKCLAWRAPGCQQ